MARSSRTLIAALLVTGVTQIGAVASRSAGDPARAAGLQGSDSTRQGVSTGAPGPAGQEATSAPAAARREPPPGPGDAALRATAGDLIRRGAEYLLAAQEADGGWASQSGPGITCLVLKALLQTPGIGADHPAVQRGLDFVRKFQREDGGIYSAEGLLKNYESSVALSMFAAHPRPPRDVMQRLTAFLRQHQWDEDDGKSLDDPWYGGAGYGRGRRPDLSNTQMMLEALRDSGLPPDDPVYRKALAFVSRCQMLGESNDQPFARGSTQGGFIYSPVEGGESKAGQIETDGRREWRCYGSMTYAGFKSLLYCGLTRDDRRVRAALDWIGRHWTLDYNPNMPEKQSREGLFYYYHVFARALEAWGEPTIRDQAGREHDWRAELVEKLRSLQRPDGSWLNDADRWMEGEPSLTTAYSMLALQAAFPPRGQRGP